MTVADFCAAYPRLYHMAEAAAWPSIRRHGLLSTSALLDLYGVTGPARARIERERRAEFITVAHAEHGELLIRDQHPMTDASLAPALIDMTPAQWYALLNERVFFWVHEERLGKLLGAYRHRRNIVIVLDTATVMARSKDLGSGTIVLRAASIAYELPPRPFGWSTARAKMVPRWARSFDCAQDDRERESLEPQPVSRDSSVRVASGLFGRSTARAAMVPRWARSFDCAQDDRGREKAASRDSSVAVLYRSRTLPRTVELSRCGSPASLLSSCAQRATRAQSKDLGSGTIVLCAASTAYELPPWPFWMVNRQGQDGTTLSEVLRLRSG